MDVRVSRASITQAGAPHSWNSFDSYVHIHETRLEQHPFVDPVRTNTLEFTHGTTYVLMQGAVFCLRNTIVEVSKAFEKQERSGRLYIRGMIYRYIAWVRGGNLVLKYHNRHADPNEYHHRAYDPKTGSEILHEILGRRQLPVFSEVPDEAEYLTSAL